VGGEAEDLSRHDKWLCMMYPRLMLLKQFLRHDGTVFISLDDNEVQSLRYIMDELFGQSNFLGTVVWEKSDSPRMDAHFFSSRHDYIVVYARDSSKVEFNRLMTTEALPAHYDKADENGRQYYLKPLRAMGGQGDSRLTRPTLFYPLIAPDGSKVYPKKQDGVDGAWRWRKEKVDEEISRIEWIKGRKGYAPYFRIYGDSRVGRPAETIWFQTEVGSNRTSKAELKKVLPELEAFPTPKPTSLLQRIFQITTKDDDLILDSFAGSGTTGHAVLAQNKEDGGNRRFILIEMDKDICRNVTAERLRRVIEGYAVEKKEGKKERVAGLGGGFRFCELGETLFDSQGKIRPEVKFEELARHVYFTETGEPPPKNGKDRAKNSPLLGVHHGTAVYLLYNGILKDKSVNGGNVLTAAVLDALPQHDGPKIIYGAGCRLGPARLKREGITFRQTPYEVKVH
jgi:site-specific DNA-methyltransferase (adenine-specific)/adenine-specific DNA-methyltransferase